jgi:murein DD-endopeptidase MepM/ murein hydrolase activator NlpD
VCTARVTNFFRARRRCSSLGRVLCVVVAPLLFLTEVQAVPSSLTKIVSRPAFVYPVMGPRLSSDFGKRKHPVLKSTRHHHGVDLAAPEQSPIRAIAGGQVIYADPYAGYGNLVVVRHDDGMTSHYGHCRTIKVSIGQRVKPGQMIATVGSTGISTGPHLHFEIRVDGQPRDPELFLPGLASAAEG